MILPIVYELRIMHLPFSVCQISYCWSHMHYCSKTRLGQIVKSVIDTGYVNMLGSRFIWRSDLVSLEEESKRDWFSRNILSQIRCINKFLLKFTSSLCSIYSLFWKQNGSKQKTEQHKTKLFCSLYWFSCLGSSSSGRISSQLTPNSRQVNTPLIKWNDFFPSAPNQSTNNILSCFAWVKGVDIKVWRKNKPSFMLGVQNKKN